VSARVVSGSLRELVEASTAYEDLDLASLARLVASNAALWPELDAPTPERRTFARVYANGELEVWVLGWRDGHETGLHDHDGSAGAVCVVEGELAEDLLVGFSSEAGIFLAPARRRAGETFTFDGGRIHNVRHAGDGPAVSVHVYSPPIRRMGHYEQGLDGIVKRVVVDHDDP
jgi:predicted metal-dependent enzyme (double-stranded beta helix superfamily)